MRHHQRGTLSHAQGDLAGAITAFQHAISAKPDFAYAYYRLGFVMEERRSARKERAGKGSASAATVGELGQAAAAAAATTSEGTREDEAVQAFRSAVALDPADEMSRFALGQALKDRGRHDEAAAAFEHITVSLNTRSAQAYWALGQVRAIGVDEWDSDPDDPRDPSHCYEHAARLQPTEFRPDGTRVKRVEPRTPESVEREEREARERRQRVLQELRDGTRKMNE